MDKIKILHCGDLHFDTPFSDLPKSISDIRREELKQTFSNIVTLAIKEKVNIFLLAGDLFDNLRVEKSTLEFMKNQMERLEGIKVFIAAGNHDPYNGNSFYSMIQWPINVYIFKENIEVIEIKELNTVVYGASFKDRYVKSSNLNGFVLNSSYSNHIKLMVLHGEISNQEDGNEYNPITLKQIGESGVDYLALGHRHSFSEFKREGNTTYAYCGCPEARGFDEIGDKGVIIGEIAQNYVDLKFQPICKRRYISKEIDITGCFTNDEIKERILSLIPKNEIEENLYKIILKGQVSEEMIIKERVLENNLKDYFFFVKVKDNTELKVDYKSLAGEFSIKGIFLSKILNAVENSQNDEEKEILELALKLGIQSLSEGEVNLDDN